VERSLAMLTAQYEKAGTDCDHLEDELNCSLPSGLAVPPPMEQLNNASRVEESVRLARELRARKEQLERLVQKNTFPSNCNELPGEPRREGGRRKETNVAGGQYGVTSGGSQYGVGAGGQFGASTTGGGQFSASQQLIRLQHQVTKLSGELDRLSGLPVSHPVLQTSHPAGPTSSTTANAVQSPQPQMRPSQGCCTAQLQTLSLSLNQVYAALWGLQRELTRTSERVAALEEGGQASSRQGRPASRESLMSSVTRREEWPAGGGEVIWPGVGGTEQSFSAPGFQHMSSSPSRQNSGADWGGNVPPWPPHPPTLPPDHHLSPFPSRDLWNSLQASPGFSPLHPSSMQLHPPPPLHPSLSLFPGAFPQERDSGVSSGALNNQVSPGVRANNYYDNFRSYSRQNRLSGGAPVNLRGDGEPANNLPSSRPRRKYKINREQNREQSRGDPTLAANTYTSPTLESGPSVDNLTKNIYSQVGSLISAQARTPASLARLLHSLTLLGNQDSRLHQDSRLQANANPQETVETSSFTSEEESRGPRRGGGSARAKASTKRLPTTLQTQAAFPVVTSAFEGSSSEQLADPGLQLGWGQAQGWNHSPPQLSRQGSGGAPSGGGVAVPKNQQKQMMSRERDVRRMPGWRDRLLPRNMQGEARDEDTLGLAGLQGLPHPHPHHDQDGFINIQLELPVGERAEEGEGASVHHSLSDMAEAELAEADQGAIQSGEEEGREEAPQHYHLPEGVFPVRDSEPGRPMVFTGGAMAGGRSERVNLGNNLVGVGAAGCLERSGVSNNLDRGAAMSSNVGPCRESNISNRGEGDSRVERASVDRDRMAGLDRVPSRLPSDVELRQRAAEEEEAVSSIVEEVLASSPELAGDDSRLRPPQ